MKNQVRNSLIFVQVLLVLFSGLIAKPAAAQRFMERHRRYEVSAVGGLSFLNSGTLIPSQTATGDVALHYGTGYLVGGRVSENRFRHLGATFSYTFANAPIAFTNLPGPTPSFGSGHSIHHFAYDLVYYPLDPYNRLRPYAFAGPGLSLFTMSANSFNGAKFSSPWKAGFDGGGGVTDLIRDRIAAGLELRDVVTGVPSYGLPANAHGKLHNGMFSVGFIYQWDP